MDPCLLTAEVVREGPRLCLVDVTLAQGDRQVARSSALFLKPTASAPGEIWSPSERPTPPPEDIAPPTDEPHVPYFFSSSGWSQNFGKHQNASRKQSWNSAIPVVAGERPDRLRRGRGRRRRRQPGDQLGQRRRRVHQHRRHAHPRPRAGGGRDRAVSAVDRVEQDGIAVGTAAVFDRTGPIGTAVVTSLSNAKRTIDFEKVTHPYDERPATGA